MLVEEDDPPPDGEWRDVDEELLRRTVNAGSLAEGMGYLTLYTSTPAVHERVLRAIAEEARKEGLGVWPVDETDHFALADQDSISPPDGTLVLPKLFRRCTDYLKAVARFPGHAAGLARRRLGHRPAPRERAATRRGTEVALSTVVQQLNQRIRFTPHLLDVVFVEK